MSGKKTWLAAVLGFVVLGLATGQGRGDQPKASENNAPKASGNNAPKAEQKNTAPKAEETSVNTPLLERGLKLFPKADANGDGVLTRSEAEAYLNSHPELKALMPAKLPKGELPKDAKAKGDKPKGEKSADDVAVMGTEIFKVTAEELDRLMQADTAASADEPLSNPKGNGLRILSTGHSWVRPAINTLPAIAKAAGYDGHHQRANLSGGMTGSANSRWRAEIGKFDGKPPRPILLPAIATGEWDAMTWGMFYLDTPEHFEQWMDVCLKHNPEMRFYLQDGWPLYRETIANDEARQQMQTRQSEINGFVQSLVEGLNAKYDDRVRVIPAGNAVMRVVEAYFDGKLPELDCVSEHLGGKNGIYRDGGHLSRVSGMELLDGYIYYSVLYQRSPALLKDYKPEGTAPNVDRVLREAAWQAAITHPLSGVVDKDGDGVGDK
jgi:hypothetical protein